MIGINTFLLFQPSLSFDGSQLHTQLLQFRYGDQGEILTHNPRMTAELVDSVPVLGIYPEFLHQMQADAPPVLALVAITKHILQCLAAFFVLLRPHLMQMCSAPIRVLAHDSRLSLFVIAVLGQLIKRGVETMVVCNRSCHKLPSLLICSR